MEFLPGDNYKVVASGASLRHVETMYCNRPKRVLGCLEMACSEDERTKSADNTVDGSTASLSRRGRLKNSGAIPG